MGAIEEIDIAEAATLIVAWRAGRTAAEQCSGRAARSSTPCADMRGGTLYHYLR